MRSIIAVLCTVALVGCQQATFNTVQPSTTYPSLPSSPPLVALLTTVSCSHAAPLQTFCRIQVTNLNADWTVHVKSSDWTWGDGTETMGYLTGIHTYPEPGTFIYTVRVADDEGHTSVATGSVAAY